MLTFEMRHMIPADAPRILDIFRQGIETGNATFDQEVPTWEKWDESFFGVCRWVITNNSEVVGWAALKPVSSRVCFKGVAEVSIYVDNGFQGKGVGTLLMKKLILDSEEQGFWTLQSGIFPENKGSIALHQKLGFRIVGRREKFGLFNGVWRDIFLLERRSQVVCV